MNKREALVNRAVDLVMASIAECDRRNRESFEYLDDVDALIERRGIVHGMRVA